MFFEDFFYLVILMVFEEIVDIESLELFIVLSEMVNVINRDG